MAQPVQAQPVRAQVQYATNQPAQVIYSGTQGPTYGNQYAPQYAPQYTPQYTTQYGNQNTMYRGVNDPNRVVYEERRFYEERRRREQADEMACLAGLTAGCCLCLALN